MISNLYYIIGLLILVISFSNMINYVKFFNIRNWALTYRRVTGKDIERKDFRTTEDYNIFTIYSLFIFIELIWMLFGIATSDWYVYLSIIIFELFLNFFTKKSKIITLSKVLGLTFNILKFSSILFLILNHFHFHYDVLGLFR